MRSLMVAGESDSLSKKRAGLVLDMVVMISAAVAAGREKVREDSGRRVICPNQREAQAHRGALAVFAVDFKIPAVQFSHALGDDQSQPRALLLVEPPLELHVRADAGDLIGGHAAT